MLSWLPQNVSTFGGSVDSTIRLIYYIVGAWFLATEGLLLYFVLRYRRKQGRRAFYKRAETIRQAAWVLIPAAIVLCLDLGIDASGASTWRKVKETLPSNAVQVEVTAQRFAWLFTYPGPDGKFGTPDDVTILGELHVPAGKPVELIMRSKDVIHSLFIPDFRFRQDVVPGRTIDAWFEAARPGSYELGCSELCGDAHFDMRGTVIVHDAGDYASWLRKTWRSAPAAVQNLSGAAKKG